MNADQNKYQVITSDLLHEIRSGELKPGDRILAERPLAESGKLEKAIRKSGNHVASIAGIVED